MNFKSKLEDWCWKLIQKHKPKKTKVDYESRKLPYTIRRHYLPDFVITLGDGSERYIEAKGYFRPEDRTKLLAVKSDNPGVDIRIVFSQDNKLNKSARSKYSDWAIKHGFPYSISSIPKDWLR